MPAPSTQDFVHGLDPTGLASITASQIMQITDAASPATDRGLILQTTDSALNTPIVPNAAVTTKWKRYIWKRILFDNSTKLYYWKESAVSDATYLKWIELNAELAEIQTEIDTLTILANDAVTDANNALSTAQTSQSISQNALDTSSLNASNIAALQAIIANLQSSIVSATFFTGDIRANAGNTSFSTSTDEGWLKCDGTAVNRVTFANLFATIGTVYGPGDGVTTFNLPDLRGRTIIGVGQGAGLTDRILGEFFGEEKHVLLVAELPSNNISVPGYTIPTGDFAQTASILAPVGAPQTDPDTTPIVGAHFNGIGTDTPHNNMQPSVALNHYIKT